MRDAAVSITVRHHHHHHQQQQQQGNDGIRNVTGSASSEQNERVVVVHLKRHYLITRDATGTAAAPGI